ncbi:MAG: hypothetical protein IT372_04385 [Polyangiaceae bacterium]|nr:hypothetical protein [Polyangiaceae bacterium]
MRGTARRREDRAARAQRATCLAAVIAAGCGGAPAPQAAAPPPTPVVTPAPAPAPRAEAQDAGAREQREAQRAWCSYLQALYLRAAEGETSWPKFQECAGATTTAAPAMLRATAECAQRALERFQGDPFTAAYAAEVSRCGAEAMDEARLSPDELSPFIATICSRVAACEDVADGECRQALEQGLGPQLTRAIGSMNQQGRTQLRTCLSNVRCEDIGGQISACIDPIMEGLLWLPG